MRKTLIAATLLCAVTAAWAHGPTRQKVAETVTIAAPPEAVWDRLKDFAALQTWHPAVESSQTTAGNEIGSVRTLNLKGGGKIVEELTRYSAEEHRLAYKMTDPGPVPVTNYSSTLSVGPGDGNTTVVEWKAGFYRGDPNNNPAPERNDDAAIAAVTGIYKAGLDNLKKLAEGK
ncbi:SRPBCC family protein [Azoarcus sp. KH32C]|uniref:SRPBCC family protein n=1 Tax=Azoarcus sp. KH32C TaxID=748247 RepID=UPI0002385DC9|nr:SRPBCC family protein [Azoarcus sp. KH32C]BAL27127.1 MxaD protein [Azoarcus sp. KH32C]